jgi:putative GTP pyrophosphokinase
VKPHVQPIELERAVAAYAERQPTLKSLALKLEAHVRFLLEETLHVDRIYFRAKDADSFARKSLTKNEAGEKKYQFPNEEIEDQVAGRVLVFFRRDIDVVTQSLMGSFNRVEHVRKAPKANDAFAYESAHLVFIIPPHLLPDAWSELNQPPTTFEMQVRTLFMHAWAEPEHDIAYKSKVALNAEEERKLAWAASSAWGGDAIFEQVLDSIARRSTGQSASNDSDRQSDG